MVTFDMLGRYGELGNQLFQIAVTEVTAQRHHTNAVFPEWICGKSYRKYSNILNRKIDESLDPSKVASVFEQDNHDYKPIPYQPNMSLRGYFQSEKYWTGHEAFVRNVLFDPAKYIKDYINEHYKEIIHTNDTVGVHIRTQTRSAHDAPSIHLSPKVEYLKRAFAEFGKNRRYVIFSDNIDLVKQWFRDYDFTFIQNGRPNDNVYGQNAIGGTDNEPIYDNVIEMFLMSMMKDQITTSSSFGWWGAWLNKNPDKQVIAMHEDMWFGPELDHLKLQDLIPESWHKIKV